MRCVSEGLLQTLQGSLELCHCSFWFCLILNPAILAASAGQPASGNSIANVINRVSPKP